MSDDDPFVDCMEAFARHEYAPVTGTAFQQASEA